MADVETSAGFREFQVRGTPERIVSMIRGYIESEEWPHSEKTQVLGGLLNRPDQLICEVDYGPNPWGCLAWIALFVVTLGSGIVVWLFWFFLMRDEFVPRVVIAAYPESSSVSRVTVTSERKPEYAEPVVEWIRHELVVKRRAAMETHQGRPTTSGEDIPAQLRKLGELRDAGVLTEDEFEAKKKDLLDRM